MAEGEELYYIGGHIWVRSATPNIYSTRPTYALKDVIRCGGDPNRLDREVPNFDGKTYSMDSSK